ncbi:type II toxin-antitoxin system RelE/ParE family toxin [Bosea sp. (in: a-proteobacteria)]|uniref:type II toxin-antitoxin system RelE/ParE family toxin n=1 Tax=Bosea sp. (in: a-proteobacteria) TaxID=1871050 RepID=UPI0027376827|nr:type II toxin-antitoxin system RelE/ParE family toxin [Bosea sp. (in: a-proteobacteria)]MDP3409671.1 type II toxin-antitoxin system RelE/ParE family toxin [Bosea sp. (in: a-proteobacteria)]
MKRYKIAFSPLAEADIEAVVDWIADQSGTRTARGFVDRIERRIESLKHFPVRGTSRDDLAPGLRLIGLERRVTIAFRVSDAEVTIERVLYGGRDLDRAFRHSRDEEPGS